MPSIVKLSSGDARAWRQNQPVWINGEGDVVRAVTREEQHAISRALTRTSRITQSFRQVLSIVPLNTSGRTQRSGAQKGARRLDCAFEIGYVGQQRVVNVYAGELRYMTGRQMLAARLLADHGEAVLHGAGGKCIAVLRDPLIQERAPSTGRRVQWSRSPEERALQKRAREARDRGESPMRHRSRGPAGTPAMSVLSPKKCKNDCRGLQGNPPWYVPKGAPPIPEDHHHPTCKYARAWAATLTPPSERFALYDLETSRVMREATEDELAEARATEHLTGSLQVTVQEQVYAVLPLAEAEQAAAEARGQTSAAAPLQAASHAELPELPAFDPRRPQRLTPRDAADEELEDEHEADTLPPEASELELDAHESIDAADVAEASDVLPSSSTAKDRQNWPTVGELTTQAEQYKTRAEVTARDYLTRQPLTTEPTG